MIEYDDTLQKAVMVDPGEADPGKVVPAEVSSLLQSDYAKGGVSDSLLLSSSAWSPFVWTGHYLIVL